MKIFATKCHLNSQAFPWQISLIILKLFFKRWRESEGFFILGYLFINFIIEISKTMVDLLIPSLFTIFIIYLKSFRYLVLLIGKPQNTVFVTFNYFLHFINDFHCLLWTFNIFRCVLNISSIIVDTFTYFLISSLIFLISFMVFSVSKF